MSVKMIQIMECSADAEKAFEQELKKLVETSLSENGCINYEIYQPVDQDGQYIMIEEWLDEDAFMQHQDSPHYKHFVRISPALQNKPAEVKQLVRLV
jgi:quinol monooxygenase YgiN